MSTLVLVTFPNMDTLRVGIEELNRLHADAGIKLDSLAVVACDAGGKLSVQERVAERHGATAAGALIGGLAGLPLGPVAAMIGAVGGALIGTSAEIVHRHDESALIDGMSRELTPGKAAIIAEVDDAGLTAFEAAMRRSGGTTIRK